MKNLYPNRYYDKKEDIPVEQYYEEGYRGFYLILTIHWYHMMSR